MFIKVHFFKCGLCIVLYLIVCAVLFKMKRNYDLTHLTNKYQSQTTSHFLISDKVIKKNAKWEVELLGINELEGEAIDLQDNAVLLQQMRNTCMKYNLKTPLITKHFLYNIQHKSLFCWIRKVASTSFTKLFSDMSNRGVNHNFYREVKFLSPRTLEDLQRFANDSTVFKLLIVRHPFQRLVSSYRDRIEDNSKYTAQAWLYARSILYLSRPEFFHFNVSNVSILQRIFLADRRLKVVPSFREFLEWLLKEPPDHDDVHWAQYYTHCATCDVNYNFILKLDEYTLGEINYVLSKLRLNRNKIYLPKLQRTRTGFTNFNVACRFFRNLTTEIVMQLYERYKVDFEMYNYKPDKYFQCANGKN